MGRTTFLDNLLHIFYMIRIGFSRSPHGLHVSFPRARFAFRFFKRRPAHSAATFVRPCGTPRINCFLQHRQIPHIKAKRNDVTFVLNQDGDSCKKNGQICLFHFYPLIGMIMEKLQVVQIFRKTSLNPRHSFHSLHHRDQPNVPASPATRIFPVKSETGIFRCGLTFLN